MTDDYRGGMDLTAEFTTEPFHGEGEPPPHVGAAAEALVEAGLDPDLGPFGTSVSGGAVRLLPALQRAMEAATSASAAAPTCGGGSPSPWNGSVVNSAVRSMPPR